MRKIFLCLVFILFAPLVLVAAFFSLNQITNPEKEVLAKSTAPSGQFYAALPQDTGEVLGEINSADARPVIIENYLQKHNSPLFPYADKLLEAAERYDVDYRLIVAIAQCESNLCKKSPPGSYNCWGFENGKTKFLSWEQAFNQVAKTLRERYLDQGLITPEEIMPKYAPPSVAKGGPWAKCVNQFRKELEYGSF